MNAWRSLPRGVPLLLANSMLMSLGFYALIPYLSFYLTQSLFWTPLVVGILLMVRQMSQQGPMFFTGMLADQIGYRTMLTLGLCIRGIGFMMFGLFTEPVALFAAAIIAGLGGALFEPTGNAALTTLTPVEMRSRVYSVKKILSNVGIVLAAVIGGVFIKFDFIVLSMICGGLFMITGILTFFRMPDVRVQLQPIPFSQMWGVVRRDRYFIGFTGICCGYYFLYMQMFLTIPLQVVAVSGRAESVSFVYLLLAGLIIVGQYPVTKLMSRYSPSLAIGGGLVIMGAGTIIFGTTDHLMVFLLGFACFALGIMMIDPAIYDFTAQLANKEMMATYFGFSYLSLAVGGGLSQGFGGLLYQAGSEMGVPSLVWWVGGLVAFASAYGMLVLHRAMQGETTERAPMGKGSLSS